MAEPTNPAKLAVVAAQDKYNAAAAVLDDLLDNFPNLTWDSMRIDTWITDAVSHWSTCEDNWSEAGVISKEWYKLEYSLLVRVPDLSMDKVKFAHREFNELVERVLDYNLDVISLPVCHVLTKHSKTTASPSQSHQGAATTGSRMVMLAPLPSSSKPTTPIPPSTEAWVIEPGMTKCASPPQNVGSSVPRLNLFAASLKAPAPSTSNSEVSKKQVTQPPADKATGAQQQTTQRKVKPTPITAGSTNVVFTPDTTSPLHQKPDAPFRFGPPSHATGSEASSKLSSSRLLTVNAATCPSVNPGPNPADEGSVASLPGVRKALFLPGTDDKLAQIQGDLVEDDRVEEEVAGTDGEDGDVRGQDDEDAQGSDEATSPPPTNMACQLHQAPNISFVFNEITGDFLESHPTIFLPRPALPTSQSQAPRRSARSHVSPVNSTAAYLKAVQVSKPEVKKKRKEAKIKDKTPEVTIPHKRARNEDEGLQIVYKSVAKKLKSKDHQTDDIEVRPTPINRRGGFGEKVPSTAKAIKNGIKSVGVLKVDQDFSKFVEVDQSYWSKAVTPFVGERVDGVATLNPVEHYHPKRSDAVNTFEAAVNAIEANSAAITVITQQFLAGLDIIVHTDNIRAQTFQLRGCLAPVEEDEEFADEELENKAPDDVAEGIAGPSQKKKGKSG
ncbi:hypothetical protein ARMGADRAFT_1084215 [Armillaria gallica]|uniref:Uncharacterized protein n=1 Tax=Armillaria gallica TaxID=47427 RepID=A0A2H3DLL9_ARMGA|nr:hypothetical protein ARMGADRAFT_1084215 [Armillaria gallica]